MTKKNPIGDIFKNQDDLTIDLVMSYMVISQGIVESYS